MKLDIEDICHEESYNKFAQIIGTPTMNRWLIRDLGFLGDSQAYLEILQRTYSLLQELDDISKALIKELQKLSTLINTPKANTSTRIFKEE